jgi:flagellar protein FliO/FliZ
MLDTLFGEGQLAVKLIVGLIVVIGLIAAFFWGLRRFGGERLGAAGGRGRQPRLAVVDAAMVDGRRRLVLIRRDNVEHLLIIGGPTDVVVEQNIVRAGGPPREAAPVRAPTAPDALPRPVPLGEGNMWPLQPDPAPREPAIREPVIREAPTREPAAREPAPREPAPRDPAPREPAPREPAPREFASRPEPPTRIEPAAIRPEPPIRLEPTMRAELRPQRAAPPPPPLAMPVANEPMDWSAEPEPPPLPLPPRERKSRAADPLAGLAEELARVPPAPEPSNIEEPAREPPRELARPLPRRASRPQPAPPAPAPAAPPAPAPAAEAQQFNSAADQNLAEMAQRLEAALRRPARNDDTRPAQSTPQAAPKAAPEPPPPADEAEEFPFVPPAASSPPPARVAEAARTGRTDAKPARTDAKPAPQKSLYDSLEQEMASLLGRPNTKP